MAYKLKHKSKKIPVEYWQKQEMERLKKKYPHRRLPPFLEIMRLTDRGVAGVEKRVHRKGHMVQYKEGIAEVKKVTKRGLWIEPWKKPSDKDLASPTGKIIFIPEKRVEHEIYPITTTLPVYISPPMQMDN